MTSPFVYKRINHFKEWTTSLFQEHKIDRSLIDQILMEQNKNQITKQSLKLYLRTHKLAKMYEHIPSIYNTIHGIQQPVLTPVIKNKLSYMFKKIQEPFQKHFPRRGFLSYSYVMYKFLEILREYKISKHIDLLKSRQKLLEHDKMFIKICKELNWPFIPTVPIKLRSKL